MRPTQNDRHITDDVSKCIFSNGNVWISVKISLKFVPKIPTNNIPAFVQIMAWRSSEDRPLSELIMASLLTHKCITRPQLIKSVMPSYALYYINDIASAWSVLISVLFVDGTRLCCWSKHRPISHDYYLSHRWRDINEDRRHSPQSSSTIYVDFTHFNVGPHLPGPAS